MSASVGETDSQLRQFLLSSDQLFYQHIGLDRFSGQIGYGCRQLSGGSSEVTMLFQKRKQILDKGIRFLLRQRFLTVLPQFPAVGIFIECQGQLPVGNISSRTEEGCCAGAALVLAEYKVCLLYTSRCV